MFEELDNNKKTISEDWLIDMKSDIARKAKHQGKLYNFDFEENSPRQTTENKIRWEKSEASFIRVGRDQVKEDFRKMDLSNLQIPTLKIKIWG
ncbi:hypothetical protein SteCoe_20197 [Stentor coeruleus]|uniref:Uncharacterized protein n=1 Tax=Stentor coeruleus TaxID=5963 RepID=A0A1R2BSI9_9CILI|nr:hypothetical protein SteCoe_20197 [Stentor coeruleus]